LLDRLTERQPERPDSPAAFPESWGGRLALSENVTFRCVAPSLPLADGATMENITPLAPAKRDLAALDQPAPPVTPGKPKRISKRVQIAIDAMVSGECKKVVDAAAKAGLARESLSRALSAPHVAEHLRQKVLPSRHRGRARRSYQGRFARQRFRDCPRSGLRFVLGLAGIQPAATPSLSLNLEIKAGSESASYFCSLAQFLV
jgi:hypothetical protein